MRRTFSTASDTTADVASPSTARRSRSLRFDAAAPEANEPSAAFRSFAASLREELKPLGSLETVLAERAIAAAWNMSENGHAFNRRTAAAERSLMRILQLLDRLRTSPSPVPAELPTEEESAENWQHRLDRDEAISKTSPVIRGTWITVEQVIALIIDGASWKDILRTYPELCEDDLRACLSYAVEGDGDSAVERN